MQVEEINMDELQSLAIDQMSAAHRRLAELEALVNPRVFFPGDELPVGAWVMGPDRAPVRVAFAGTRVKSEGRDLAPLVEVPVPDYDMAVRGVWTCPKGHRNMGIERACVPCLVAAPDVPVTDEARVGMRR